MSSSTKIFMTGEAGYHNLGDEGMAQASLLRLRQYFPDAEIVATGLDPLGAVLRHQATIVPWPLLPHQLTSSYGSRLVRKVARRLGVTEEFLDPLGRDFDAIFADQYRHNEVFRNVVHEIESADFIFDMGHGALNDVFNPFMLCFTYYLSGRLNKPLFISGQTIGPVWREQSRRMLKETLPNAHTLGLRDEKISYRELVENIGFRSDTTRLVEVGDDTLDLPAVAPDFSCLPASVQQLLENGRFMALQWRMSDYTAAISMTQQLIPIIEAVRLLYKETGLIPLFVPLSWEMGHNDILVAARIKDYLQDEIPFQAIWNYLPAQEIKWLLGRARFGLGLSYHFHVFLLTQGVPTIALYTNPYYELKLKGVYAAYGYDGEPSSYETENVDLREHLSRALSIINTWTGKDVMQLKSNAAGLSTQWHKAFEEFIADSDLA